MVRSVIFALANPYVSIYLMQCTTNAQCLSVVLRADVGSLLVTISSVGFGFCSYRSIAIFAMSPYKLTCL